jgi:hypothetical protein
MNSDIFIPEDFGFILRSDYTPPLAPPAHYERDSPDYDIRPNEDWGRINVFLSKDDDFVCIWYGVIDSLLANGVCQKLFGFEWTKVHGDSELFRGFICTKHEAKVIFNALRFDRYRIELNLGLERPDS